MRERDATVLTAAESERPRRELAASLTLMPESPAARLSSRLPLTSGCARLVSICGLPVGVAVRGTLED
jgi:hypothetical protein